MGLVADRPFAPERLEAGISVEGFEGMDRGGDGVEDRLTVALRVFEPGEILPLRTLVFDIVFAHRSKVLGLSTI